MTAQRTSPGFIAVFAVCAILGIFFRLYHVDWKLYSFDETVTSLRVSGHTIDDFQTFIRDGREHRIGELEAYQAPSASTSQSAVWNSLAEEDPQHPPLYFVLTSLLQKTAGDSLFLRRLPAVIFGLLALPAIWWFSFELFRDRFTAWCVTALVAVSPLQVAFAQQAREYSLWTLTIALSSALLLRGLRAGDRWVWPAYALSIAVGFWSFALFAVVAAAHAAYVVLPYTASSVRRRIAAGMALAIGTASFVPWILVMIRGAQTALGDTAWSATHVSLPLYLGKWVFNAGTVFFDLDFLTLALLPVVVIALGIAAWCTYALVRTSATRVWLFVVLLGAMAALASLGPDLLFHQTRAIESRYLTPLWLALELATGFGLASALRSAVRRSAFVGRGATAFVLCAGAISCGVASNAHNWWIAANEQTLPAVAAGLAQQPAATLVYVSDPDMLLEILPLARPDLTFFVHPALDGAALRSASHAFVIAKQSAIDRSLVAARLHRLPLPAVFPSGQDRAIAGLHSRASSERSVGTYENESLFAVTPSGA